MKEYEYYIEKIKEKLNKDDLFVIITALITGIINYIYLLTHNCLSHDGLFYGPVHVSGNWEFDLGRPLLTVIDKLRGGLVAPNIIFSIGIICICITLILIKRIFKINKKIPLLLITIMLVTFPTIADTALYIFCFDSYCIAMLLSTLAVYMIIKKKYIFAIISIASSLALYQAYISMTVTLLIIYYINETIDNKLDIKEFIKNILIIFVGMIIYYLCLKIGMKIFHRTLADYKGANELGLTTIINMPKNIILCYRDFYDYLFKDNIIINSFYKRNIYNMIIIFCFIFILIKILKRKTIKQNIITILLLMILPISICIINIIASGTNIISLTAIGFYALYILIINTIDKHVGANIIRNIGIITIFIICFTFFLADNGEFMARQDTYNNFYQKTSVALNKVVNLDNYDEEKKWMFSSVYTYNSPLKKYSLGFASSQNETFDNFIGLEGIKIFYKRYHGKDIELVDYETYKKITETEEYKKMKINTEKIIDNVIVIKNSYTVY